MEYINSRTDSEFEKNHSEGRSFDTDYTRYFLVSSGTRKKNIRKKIEIDIITPTL